MKRVSLLLIALVTLLVFSCTGNKSSQDDYPLFWTWLDYHPGMNFDSLCAIMEETGIDGVMLNAATPDEYRHAIPIAHDHGIEVYAWLWTMNLEFDRDSMVNAHPGWQSINRNGESLKDTPAYVDYYKFMSPVLPEVREYILNRVTVLCEVEGLNGISIDYHRFVDVILPTTLWPKYGVIQDREYPEFDYGYHPEMIRLFQERYGYDPREQDDPSADGQWLQFRCDQITEVANMIADVVHSYGKKMAASPFPTPEMAKKMVRQDWGKWNLDIVFPMVYHDFYTGDVSFISDCTLENVRDKNRMTTLYCGMTATNGPVMFESMDAALNSGAEGISIFMVTSLRSPDIRAKFKIYADSVRAARKTVKGRPEAPALKAANSNPFDNEGIMNGVRFRMLAYLSLENTLRQPEVQKYDRKMMEYLAINAMQVNTAEEYLGRLEMSRRWNPEAAPLAKAVADQFMADSQNITLDPGEYQLTDEYDVTKQYAVTEQQSGKLFRVTFYFYGGVISGWNVEPAGLS